LSDLSVNVDATVEFLVGLLNTPSPTGYTVEGIEYTCRAFEALGLSGLTLSVLPKGALVMTLKGAASDKPIALTAHVDTLGLMVKEIKASGTLKTTNLGGIMWGGVEFENVTVRTHDNQRYRGTMIPNNPSTHVNTNIGKQERNADTMEVRLDARTTNADQTRALGIEVGDFIFVDPRVEVVDTGFIRGRHLDNKAGVAVIYGALMALRDAGLTPVQDTTILIANYEEVGHGGAAGFPNNLVELLTIDMGALGDGQRGDEYSVSLCIKDSGGPYHFDMNNKLRQLAATHDIPLKTDIYPSYSSDGTAYWRSGGQGRVGLIGPGVASSHAYERTHKDSLHHTAHMIARYLLAPVE
jgi:putative aminopeptidase FrvX